MKLRRPDPLIEIPALVLFGGGGLGSMGLEEARFGVPGMSEGRLHAVASIDAWDKACRVHDYLCPGSRAVQWDLFTRADYEAFHGHPPPPGWREITPEDLRRLFIAAGYPEGPEFVFFSPPCKGFSSNLSEKKARSARYQALNRLVSRGIWLVMKAWPENPPALFVMENVPRIRNRGADLLNTVQLQLRSYGYLLDDRDHDAGELGGLAQTRKRFLLAGRLPSKCPAPVQLAPRKPLKGIGEVIGQLPIPLPGTDLPPMHEVPRGQHWLTALRLALIPPGRDWRALREVEAYAVAWHPGRGLWMVAVLRDGEPWRAPSGWEEGLLLGRWEREEGGILASWMADRGWTQLGYRLRAWEETAGTVGSHGGSATGSAASFVADPRIGRAQGRFPVVAWETPSGTVTSQDGPSCGAMSVADPRVRAPWRSGNLQPATWAAPVGAVTCGTAHSDGGKHIADPRISSPTRHAGSLGVQGWEGAAATVTGASSTSSGPRAVADPRLGRKKFNNAFRVVGWEERGIAVTGGVGPTSGGQAVADPRLGCAPRAGAYGVMGLSETSPTVAASVDIHAGTAAVADARLGAAPGGGGAVAELADLPRLPGPRDPGAWVILSPWDAWHRPCTTLEVALLQSLPARVRGAPLDFYALGLSDSDAREVIGNGVPRAAARAIGEEFGLALLEGQGAVQPRLLLGGKWVINQEEVSDV